MSQNKIKGRDYQYDAMQAFFDYFNNGNTGNPIIYVAGGGGKSVIIALIIEKIMELYRGQRIIISAGSMDLVGQNYSKLVNLLPLGSIGIYSAGLGKKQPWCDIVYGGIQSMCKSGAKFGHRDLLFVDECQDLAPEDEGRYKIFINELKKKNPYLKVIGFSATPWREKGGSLVGQEGGIFTDIIYEISQKFLTEQGYLAPLISKSSLIQANLSGVNITSSGEFNLKKAEAAIDKEGLTLQALAEVDKLTQNRKNFLFFCAGVGHAIHATSILKNRNWDATIITGETDKKLRPQLLEKFRKNIKKQALVNNRVLTVGTDLPNTDCIVLWMATNSLGLYVQILSRGTRPIYAPGYDLETKAGRLAAIAASEKPNCLVLCYGGNIERFGAVDLIQIPKEKKKGAGTGIAPQKICPQCREPVLIMLKECPTCAYEFPEDEKAAHSHVATTAAIMAAEIKPERYEIASVKYSTGIDKNNNTYAKISYFDSWGLIANEFVHFAYQKGRLVSWHNERLKDNGLMPTPESAEELIAMKDNYLTPTAIYTKKSGKYQEITDYEFN